MDFLKKHIQRYHEEIAQLIKKLNASQRITILVLSIVAGVLAVYFLARDESDNYAPLARVTASVMNSAHRS